MVAARDPLFQFLPYRSRTGKVIIGNCNGARCSLKADWCRWATGCACRLPTMPSGKRTSGCHRLSQRMDLITRHALKTDAQHPTGRVPCIFRLPMAREDLSQRSGSYRGTRGKRPVAFRYCDANANVSAETPVTPGSTGGIAGICNPQETLWQLCRTRAYDAG